MQKRRQGLLKAQDPRGKRRALLGLPQSWYPGPAHLHAQDAEDDEEGTADDHNVADGLQ